MVLTHSIYASFMSCPLLCFSIKNVVFAGFWPSNTTLTFLRYYNNFEFFILFDVNNGVGLDVK